METFSALLAICAGNSPVAGEIPAQRPVTRNFDVFFDLRLNKRLNGEASDLRRHRAHYDVTLMGAQPFSCWVLLSENKKYLNFPPFLDTEMVIVIHPMKDNAAADLVTQGTRASATIKIT